MKQKKSGSKVINWHRPLGVSALRKRYLRARHAEARVTREQPGDNSMGHAEDCDFCWDYCNCGDDIDYAVLKAWNVILQGDGWGQLRTSFAQVPWVAELQRNRTEDSQLFLDTWQADTEGVEARLAEHLKQLANAKQTAGWLPAAIVAALHDPRELETLYGIFAEPTQTGLALKLLMFAPFWTRPLSQWVPANLDLPSNLFALLEHLFVRYPVPKFLYSEWQGMPDSLRLKWLCWFILLGQGRSLQKAAPFFGWNIARKFQHHFQHMPPNLSPTEACMYAEILRLGGSLLEFERLCTDRAFIIDPTSVSSQPSYQPFWQQTVGWISKQRNDLTREDTNHILSWAMHQYTEAERAGGQAFSWQGRSLPRVIELSNEYHRQISRPFAAYTWQPHGWEWAWQDQVSGTWSFTELISGEELFAEGQAMHHCVAGYAQRCAAGYSAIVALRCNDLGQITIELNPHTKKLVQARGSYNCSPDARQQAIINQWLNRVVLPTPKQLPTE